MRQNQGKTSAEDLIGSILNGLWTALGQIVFPTLSFVEGAPSFLWKIIGGALRGLSNGLKNGNLIEALTGLLGGLARNVTRGFQKILTRAIAKFLQGKRNAMSIETVFKLSMQNLGSNPKLNAKIVEFVRKALNLGFAKQDAENVGRSKISANINDVGNLLKFLLQFILASVSNELLQTSGLVEGLLKGLSDDKGGSLEKAFNGLAKGTLLGSEKFLNGTLSLAK